MNNTAPKNICICLSHKINDNYELSKDSKRRIKKTCSVFFVDFLFQNGTNMVEKQRWKIVKN